MIRFIFYATRPELFVQEIKHIHSLLFSYHARFVIINDRVELLSFIPESRKESTVLLLFASTHEELEDLVNIKEQFSAIPTVLVLPDDCTETVQKGMLLHPLYFMTKHDDPRDFSSAINQLCHIYEDFTQKARYSSITSMAVSAG